MSTITQTTRQMSFDDIQDKTKIRYIQILNRLDKPKTAKELAVELFDLGFIPSTKRNYTAPRLSELEDMGMVKAIDKRTFVIPWERPAIATRAKQKILMKDINSVRHIQRGAVNVILCLR